MRSRRRDYATDLSDTEEATLALLRSRIPPGTETGEAPMIAASPRRRGMAYLSAAAVVIAVTAGSAVATTLSRPDSPPGPATTAGRAAPIYGVDQLLTTLDRAEASAGTAGPAQRRSLSVVVAREADGCRVSTVAVQTSMISAAPRGPLAGRLAVSPADLPRAAPRLPGCASAVADPPRLDGRGGIDTRAADLGGAWRELAAGDDRLARSPGPVGAAAALQRTGDGSLAETAGDADTYGRSVAKLCTALDVDCAAFSWTVAAELLADPAITPERRAVAVRQAAAAGAASAVPAGLSDLTGRAGVTLRVPYLVGSPAGFAGARRTTAELTFDRRTGALLQLTTRDATGDRTEAVVLDP